MKRNIQRPHLAFVLAAIFAVAQLAILPGMLNWSERIEEDPKKVQLEGKEAAKASIEISKAKSMEVSTGDQAQSSVEY